MPDDIYEYLDKIDNEDEEGEESQASQTLHDIVHTTHTLYNYCGRSRVCIYGLSHQNVVIEGRTTVSQGYCFCTCIMSLFWRRKKGWSQRRGGNGHEKGGWEGSEKGRGCRYQHVMRHVVY